MPIILNATGQCFETFQEQTCVVSEFIFNLFQLGIEPRSLDLQANTIPRRCKIRLLPKGSRSVNIYLDAVTFTTPLEFEIRLLISWYRNHVKMRLREIFMQKQSLGELYIVVERQFFSLSQPRIKLRALDSKANFLPSRCKRRFLP